MSELILAETQVQSLGRHIAPIVRAATDLAVEDTASYQAAGEILTAHIKPAQQAIAAGCGPVVTAAHKAHKAALAQQKALLDPLQEAETIIKQKMRAYKLAEMEAQRRAEAKQAEELRRQAEEEQLRRAVALESAGQTAAAEAELEGPAPMLDMPPPVVTAPPVRAEGISERKAWKVTVTDLGQLVQAVCDGKAPATCLEANLTPLRQLAQATNGAVQIPGVSITEDLVIGSRAR